jgi:2-methylcitrate dehydratase PrpD
MTATPDYLERLARFVSDTKYEDIPVAVIARAREILVDSFPVIACGMRTPELVALSKTQIDEGVGGPCWVIGTGRTAGRFDAAMLNGIAGAWLDYDEGNFLANGHPGMQVLPAALATAQATGASGRQFLAAFALGYEVVARIGAASKLKLIVNPHGTFGVVGAALATARLLGVDGAHGRAIASLAASSCMATNRHTMRDGATVRNWYAGHSASMGQMAVRLVQSGFTGPQDGVSTTFSMVLGEGFDPEVAADRLGEHWMLPGGYLKLYPTARYAHSAIDALFDALAKAPGGRVQAADIERIDVRAYRLAALLANNAPAGWFGTRFSIPFAIATLVVGGRNGLDAFSDEAVADPVVKALALRVNMREDEAFNTHYPLRQQVELAIYLKDGSRYEGSCIITSGEPARPHAAADLERKYRELADPLWGRAKADALRAALLHIDECADMRTLVDFNP